MTKKEFTNIKEKAILKYNLKKSVGPISDMYEYEANTFWGDTLRISFDCDGKSIFTSFDNPDKAKSNGEFRQKPDYWTGKNNFLNDYSIRNQFQNELDFYIKNEIPF